MAGAPPLLSGRMSRDIKTAIDKTGDVGHHMAIQMFSKFFTVSINSYINHESIFHTVKYDKSLSKSVVNFVCALMKSAVIRLVLLSIEMRKGKITL